MTEGTDKTSLKQLFQGMTKGEMEVLQGTVKSVNPLKIQVSNDEKLLIGPEVTYVPRHLTDYTTVCTLAMEEGHVHGPTADGSGLTDFVFTGRLTVHNALQAGEGVHMLSFCHGKQYYVLDRVG